MSKKVILSTTLVLVTLTIFCQTWQNINYLSILRASKYDNISKPDIPDFFYQNSNAPDLVALRKKFNLDSIAGFGNEVSRLLNLLHWVHNTVRHDGEHESGITEINASSIINTAESRHIGVSCGENAPYLPLHRDTLPLKTLRRDRMHASGNATSPYCRAVSKIIKNSSE